jgi:mRNA-degrading endonuclease toxin of MazEF toxin-antitoxin module
MEEYEIVIVEFPYIDKPWESKKRPCVLLTQPNGEYDIVIIAYITSQDFVSSKLETHDIKIKPDNYNNLTKDSVIQLYKLTSIMEKDIVSSVGVFGTKIISK